MTTEVGICNMALSMVGNDANTISSLTESNKAARLCNLHYVPLRDAVLRAHNWNFAIKRAALAASTDTPVSGFTYCYPLPTDYLRLVETEEEEEFGIEYAPYRIEGPVGSSARNLLTDAGSPVNITYIMRVTDPNAFDPLFVQALATRLAAQICTPLTDNANMTNGLRNAYKDVMREAKGFDGQEGGSPRGLEADTWINSRI